MVWIAGTHTTSFSSLGTSTWDRAHLLGREVRSRTAAAERIRRARMAFFKRALPTDSSKFAYTNGTMMMHNLAGLPFEKFLGFQCTGDASSWPKVCDQTCSSGRGEIPSLVHMTQLGDNMEFHHWLSVMSAIRFMRPVEVLIHHIGPQTTCWARRIRAHPLVRFVAVAEGAIPSRLNGVKVEEPAHKSNFLRLAVLWQYGGVYMDLGTIATKSFTGLMFNEGVPCRQVDGRVAKCILLWRARSCLVCEYAKRTCRLFDGRWVTHSVASLTDVLLGYDDDEEQSLSYPDFAIRGYGKGFTPLSWEQEQLKSIFSYDAVDSDFDPSDVYASHLSYTQRLTLDSVKSGKTPSALVAQQVLPEGFSERHFDETRCPDVPLVTPL
ncbi:uncharacterized protein LOC135821930 [Sycon ciliatum]|uniref:uncharacterized protein LOC135821930 n=1 Tax=Sycon ciliatum TaxID=27933 RepID=UPI0031F6C580